MPEEELPKKERTYRRCSSGPASPIFGKWMIKVKTTNTMVMTTLIPLNPQPASSTRRTNSPNLNLPPVEKTTHTNHNDASTTDPSSHSLKTVHFPHLNALKNGNTHKVPWYSSCASRHVGQWPCSKIYLASTVAWRNYLRNIWMWRIRWRCWSRTRMGLRFALPIGVSNCLGMVMRRGRYHWSRRSSSWSIVMRIIRGLRCVR
mmetsp:Transcript_3495/g.3930  ORF Transcript_3495/g.3930 Transcript_3495/m.3930 type:complete len:203 (+) Transcript_3495:423-1031(+)